MVVVEFEVLEIETVEVEVVVILAGGALPACRKKPERLEIWLWIAGWQCFHGMSLTH